MEKKIHPKSNGGNTTRSLPMSDLTRSLRGVLSSLAELPDKIKEAPITEHPGWPRYVADIVDVLDDELGNRASEQRRALATTIERGADAVPALTGAKVELVAALRARSGLCNPALVVRIVRGVPASQSEHGLPGLPLRDRVAMLERAAAALPVKPLDHLSLLVRRFVAAADTRPMQQAARLLAATVVALRTDDRAWLDTAEKHARTILKKHKEDPFGCDQGSAYDQLCSGVKAFLTAEHPTTAIVTYVVTCLGAPEFEPIAPKEAPELASLPKLDEVVNAVLERSGPQRPDKTAEAVVNALLRTLGVPEGKVKNLSATRA